MFEFESLCMMEHHYDGASSNLAIIKLLCGCEHEQVPLSDGEDPFAVLASFENPYEGAPLTR